MRLGDSGEDAQGTRWVMPHSAEHSQARGNQPNMAELLQPDFDGEESDH